MALVQFFTCTDETSALVPMHLAGDVFPHATAPDASDVESHLSFPRIESTRSTSMGKTWRHGCDTES